MTRSADLPALLGSRICHDLISPLGAISNGVELLTMAGADLSPELELISESVENANARIRFFRVAFGATEPGQRLAASEIRQILTDLTRKGRIEMVWEADGDPPREMVKLAFLLMLCLEAAMAWGGRITVRQGAEGRWQAEGRADRMQIDTRLWEALSRPELGAGLSAAEVQFLLVPGLAQELGRTLTLEISETAITARF